MDRFVARLFTRLVKPILASVVVLLFVGLSLFLQSPASLSPLLERQPGWNLKKVANHARLRAAFAAGLDGELDTVADRVYGQNSFVTGTAPNAATATSLKQASALFVFDTGQVFVADTAHNRVLGWKSVDNYQIGDPADLVLGQTSFASATAPNPPSAASMNQPKAVTVGADGILYVADSGNHRVLIFLPLNLCDFYGYYDEVWCIQANGYQFPAQYVPVFESGMTADYALGQPDMISSSPQPVQLWRSTASPAELARDSWG